MSPWLPLPQQPQKTSVSSSAWFCFSSCCSEMAFFFLVRRGKAPDYLCNHHREDPVLQQHQGHSHVSQPAEPFSQLPLPLAWKSLVLTTWSSDQEALGPISLDGPFL